jgi:NADPH-dependent 2,4-dienoyl-CoA reductase/sulfur reductase-like enzyme
MYDKLLIATGGTPKQLSCGDGDIIYYRDFQDYLQLRKLAEEKERFLVIGGGYIGSEIAAALTMVGKQVIIVFPDDAIGAQLFPSDLAHYLNDYYREKGVEVVPNDLVEGVHKEGDRLVVRTKNGRTFEVDGAVAGIGIRPNVELAKQAGLEVDNGIVVSERLETTAPDIYAAGDVANFYHFGLGERTRVEHEDNAVSMGKIAGINMAGGNEIYDHTPMFYSDLFELGYEAVGKLDSRLETVEDWQEPFQKGTVYYLKDGKIRGVLLWNFWKQVNNARALLNEEGPFTEEDLVGRLEAR